MTRLLMNDDAWNLIADVFPEPRATGRPPVDRRIVMDGIFWILRTGAAWRDLPAEFGSFKTVWRLFDQWNADGTLDKILKRFQAAHIDMGIDNELWCIDGTVVRAHRCAAGGGKKNDPDEPEDHALGRSRGGFSTKIHILCDGQGLPLHFHLTPGQTHESTQLDTVLMGADANLFDSNEQPVAWPKALGGDKGYRAAWIDEYLIDLGIEPVIPSKVNEDRDARPMEFDSEAYKDRNIVERLIGWLKESRRIFSRFEKTAKNYGGMIKLAFIRQYMQYGF